MPLSYLHWEHRAGGVALLTCMPRSMRSCLHRSLVSMTHKAVALGGGLGPSFGGLAGWGHPALASLPRKLKPSGFPGAFLGNPRGVASIPLLVTALGTQLALTQALRAWRGRVRGPPAPSLGREPLSTHPGFGEASPRGSRRKRTAKAQEAGWGFGLGEADTGGDWLCSPDWSSLRKKPWWS